MLIFHDKTTLERCKITKRKTYKQILVHLPQNSDNASYAGKNHRLQS